MTFRRNAEVISSSPCEAWIENQRERFSNDPCSQRRRFLKDAVIGIGV